ncbi:glycoside hydrolase family 73 protein [Mesotoga sp.]|uniref:glycoside hydrolase family 73 protein n=1 Tax=Mesotoga sp. TaxID=2053577 RepID=UPI00345E0FAE
MTLLAAQVSTMEVDVPMGVKMDFIEKYRDDAILVGLACDFPPIILLVQAALETGWGKHIVSNNLYGIKDVPWLPGSVEATTAEYDGEWKTEIHSFETFDSPLESMLAYIVKIRTEDRYKTSCWETRRTPLTYFQKLQEAGYATDPDYAKKLTEIYDNFPDWEKE